MENRFLNASNTRKWHILVEAAKKSLESSGYIIERLPGRGRSNIWKIEKDGHSQLASIRTTQDRWIAFPPLEGKWKTLNDVDLVLVAAVDDRNDPKNVDVYLFPADEVRERFDASYKARIEAGQKVRDNFGMWVCLDKDNRGVAASAGSGISEEHEKIAAYSLSEFDIANAIEAGEGELDNLVDGQTTIADVLNIAKQQIAKLAGVMPEQIKLDLKIEN